jgi:hypothetical protein
VKVWNLVVLLLKRELDSLPECLIVMVWMATITGDHVGYNGFVIWGIFLQGEKFWGAKIHTSFGIEFSGLFVLIFCGLNDLSPGANVIKLLRAVSFKFS